MKYILILSATLPLLESWALICQACFRSVCYTKHKLFEDKLISGQIAIDRTRNLLHLHHKDNSSIDHTSVIDLNYDDLRMEELPTQFSFARAVNQDTSEVYFSGYKGIYRYSAVTNQTDSITSSGSFSNNKTQIWHMQFKNGLYFTEYQEKGLHYMQNEKTYFVNNLADYVIDDFIIDGNNDVYFVSNFLVYRLKNGESTPTVFTTNLYSLATDIYDNAYFIDTYTNTLYTIDYAKYTLEVVGMFEKGPVYRMTFDKQNRIVYVDSAANEVILLVPNKSRCTMVDIAPYTLTDTEQSQSQNVFIT